MSDAFPGCPVIDAHHHFWELGRFPYRWLAPEAGPARFGDKGPIRRNFLPPDLLTEAAGLDLVGSVHVQANCGADDPVDETRWLDTLARETGWPSAIVAEVDLTAPEAIERIEAHLDASPRLRGIRTPVAWDEAGRWRVARAPGVLQDPAFDAAARQLARCGLVLDMVVVPDQLPEVMAFAEAHPDLTIAIDHFATLEPHRPGNAGTWRTGIAALAQVPNVFVKISGLWTADASWSAVVVGPFVAHALEHLGPERLMWGSNLPVERVNCPLDGQIASLARILGEQTERVVRRLFHDTARQVYRLGGPDKAARP